MDSKNTKRKTYKNITADTMNLHNMMYSVTLIQHKIPKSKFYCCFIFSLNTKNVFQDLQELYVGCGLGITSK